MTSAVAVQEGHLAKKDDSAARERYKSRREDRKPGVEEIEALRTDQIFAKKRSESNLAVRTCSLIVDPRLPDSTLFSHVSGVCKALLRRWADVEDSNISVSKITGGITNMLLKAQVEGENESQLPPVTVRVFGPNTDAVIDRDRELQALTYLSSAGFGAKLLGVFGNGMIQSFIVGRTLEPSDMGKPELAKLTAVEVRRLHGLEIPGSKEPQLWHDIYKFLNKASTVSFEDSEKQKTYETISFDSIRAEVEELREFSASFNAPIVFSHNDLLSGNFMYNEDEGKLHIIDYEYGSHSYRGYDIANYFNEHAGFECDYSLYPDKEKQFYFFRHYLHPENPEMVSLIGQLWKFCQLVIDWITDGRFSLYKHTKVYDTKTVRYLIPSPILTLGTDSNSSKVCDTKTVRYLIPSPILTLGTDSNSSIHALGGVSMNWLNFYGH